ncbi:MAG TPA: hypothetical protein DCO75_06220 [Fibrobacteres bacterium]|nr:hypothetical protein [Fibrobacterota bacterium]
MFKKDNDDEIFFDVAKAVNAPADKSYTPEKKYDKSELSIKPEDDEISFDVTAKKQSSVSKPADSEKAGIEKQVIETPAAKTLKADTDEIAFEITDKFSEKEKIISVSPKEEIISKTPEFPKKQLEDDEIFIKIDKVPEKEKTTLLPEKKYVKLEPQTIKLPDSKAPSPSDVIYSRYNGNKLKSADHKNIANVSFHPVEFPKANLAASVKPLPEKLEEDARHIINPEHEQAIPAPASAVCFPNFVIEKAEKRQQEIINLKIPVAVEASSGQLNNAGHASNNVKSGLIKMTPRTFSGKMSAGKNENTGNAHSFLSSGKSGSTYPVKMNSQPVKNIPGASYSQNLSVQNSADVTSKEEKHGLPTDNNIKNPEFNAAVDSVDPQKKYCVASLKGHISQDRQKYLEAFFDNILVQGYRYVICDMSELASISSSGWGTMVAYMQRLKKHGGCLYLCAMSGIVDQGFRVLELDKLILSFPSVKEAVDRATSELCDAFAKNKSVESASVKAESPALLSLEDKIKRIVVDNPDEGAGHICKVLKSQEYGSTKIGLWALQSKLRSMNLHTKEERRRFFRSA